MDMILWKHGHDISQHLSHYHHLVHEWLHKVLNVRRHVWFWLRQMCCRLSSFYTTCYFCVCFVARSSISVLHDCNDILFLCVFTELGFCSQRWILDFLQFVVYQPSIVICRVVTFAKDAPHIIWSSFLRAVKGSVWSSALNASGLAVTEPTCVHISGSWSIAGSPVLVLVVQIPHSNGEGAWHYKCFCCFGSAWDLCSEVVQAF